jgi:glycosyltransferase involved in cell wall biosynthesis
MKPGIILNAVGDSNWIGGIYYIRNIAYQISQNKQIKDKFNIFILTNKQYQSIYDDIDVHKIIISEKINKFDLIFYILKYNIKFRYPGLKNIPFINCKAISWVPDFQQERLPEMFSNKEIKLRKKERLFIIKKNIPLTLSSNDSQKDFYKYYTKNKKNLYVMPFVSYIKPEIEKISNDIEDNVLTKYNLKTKFVYIANQFWKHKNHLIVLKCIKKLIDDNKINNVKFVFSGKLSDYRNPNYISIIENVFFELKESNLVVNLGFIERLEQLIIMKNAEFIIQPSLFEGWGTVVEDAKVFDKTIILSDIPVHQEQKSDKSILFNPLDHENLAEVLITELNKKHHNDIQKGINRMQDQAKIYSNVFQKLLEEI